MGVQGCAPDCDERDQCQEVGMGHAQCGHCAEHGLPRHHCQCGITARIEAWLTTDPSEGESRGE